MTWSEDGYTVERWLYAGLRLDGKGTKYIAWQPAEGDELWYRAGRSDGVLSIGATYEVQVRRYTDDKGDHITKRATTPVYVEGRDPDDPRPAEWTATTAIANVRIASARRSKKDAEVTALDDALRPLMRIAAKQRLGADRDAFVAHVVRKLTGAWS